MRGPVQRRKMTCLQMSLGWWNQHQRAQSPLSTVQASSSSAAVPLWKRVGTYVHRVLRIHFQNIRDKVTQCVGSPPVRGGSVPEPMHRLQKTHMGAWAMAKEFGISQTSQTCNNNILNIYYSIEHVYTV